MKRLAIFTLLLAAVWTLAWRTGQSELDSLRADTAKVRAERAAVESRKGAPGESTASVDPKELARLRALQPELARLRGQIGSLRQRANQTLEELDAKAAETKAEANLFRARLQAKERSKAVGNSIGSCMMLVHSTAVETDGTIPRTWEEVRSRLNEKAAGGKLQFTHMLKEFEQLSGPQGVLGEFELMPVPADVRIERRGQPIEALMIRERQPRPQPDGGFSRYYGWTTWRTEEATVKDGNFAAWETQHSGSTAAGSSPQ